VSILYKRKQTIPMQWCYAEVAPVHVYWGKIFGNCSRCSNEYSDRVQFHPDQNLQNPLLLHLPLGPRTVQKSPPSISPSSSGSRAGSAMGGCCCCFLDRKPPRENPMAMHQEQLIRRGSSAADYPYPAPMVTYSEVSLRFLQFSRHLPALCCFSFHPRG